MIRRNQRQPARNVTIQHDLPRGFFLEIGYLGTKGTRRLRLNAQTTNLKPGDYTCQVTVIDPAGHKFAFPRTGLAILPEQGPSE